MKKLVSIALCGLAAAAFTVPAAANDADKVRGGANASVEGGAALGGTGIDSKAGAGGTVTHGAGNRTGDAQARRDNAEGKDVDQPKPKPKTRAERKQERDSASGATGPSKTY